MGCCGKARKAAQRGLGVPEPARRGPMVSDPMSRSAVPVASARALPSGGGGGYTVIPKSGAMCATCGTRTVLKRRYSDRLRRYFEVHWCSTCKAATS